MNMILAGDGHSNIHMKDSLANPVDGTEEYDEVQPDGKTVKRHRGYDVVITNMPYSQKTKHGNLYDLPSNNGDSICVQHCMKAVNSISENGRMALVVPEGFLFRKDISKTRELLLKNCDLQSVVSLPQGVFLPYTGVKTNILYATKINQKLKASQKRKDFWYFEVKSDGYTLDNHRRKLDSGSDLDKPQEYRKLDDDRRQEMLDVGFEAIPLEKVRENSFILVGSRYREVHNETYNYESRTIFSLCKNIVGGGTPSTQNKEYWTGHIPWITSADIDDSGKITVRRHISAEGLANSASNVVPRDNVIVVSRVGLGKVAVNKVDTAISQDLQGLIIDTNQVLPSFFVSMYSKLADTIKNKARGTTIKGVTKEELFNLTIPVPPLELQQQIVDELDSYQRIIDGARAVMDNYMPKLPNLTEYPTVELGMTDLFEIQSGGTPDSKNTNYWNGDINWITLVDLPSDDYITNIVSTERKITQEGLNSSSAKLLPVDTVVVSSRATIGRVGIAKIKLATNQGFKNIIIKDKKRILPEFLAYSLREKSDELLHLAIGATFKEISKTNFETITINLPPLSLQESIIQQLESEKLIIEPSKKVIDMFSKKIQNRINEIWGEQFG
jgi:type I restriction enzyme M protein